MCNRLPIEHIYATIDEAMLAFNTTNEVEYRVRRRVKNKPTKGRKRLRRVRREGGSDTSGSDKESDTAG